MVDLKNLVAALGWLGFVLLGLLGVWAERKGRAAPLRRHLTNALLLYALVMSFTAGLTRHELWPFSHWPMMADNRTAAAGHVRIFGVDSQGREFPVDPHAWQPLSWEELMAWLDFRFAFLTPQEQESAARHLLDLANAGRLAGQQGRTIGTFTHLLGPLTAPTHMLHPRLWSDPSAVPHDPFVGLRFIRESWNVNNALRDRGPLIRTLIYEYPRPR